MKYKIEYEFAYGFDDAGWMEDDKPLLFDSVEEAQQAIDEHLADISEAVANGDMLEEEDEEAFRIVPCDE